jgi:Uma2 family endonuclease
MAMPVATHRRWKAEEVRNLQDESRAWPRYELIDGELYVTPAPGFRHQAAVLELVVILRPYVVGNKLGGVLTSPADIELEPESVLQPDVFVFPPLDVEQPEWRSITSLRLAIEVISPSSIRTDRTKKRDQYLKMAVDEYWVVDVEGGHVERWFKHRPDVEVARSTLEWHPANAAAPLSIDLDAMFATVRNYGRKP